MWTKGVSLIFKLLYFEVALGSSWTLPNVMPTSNDLDQRSGLWALALYLRPVNQFYLSSWSVHEAWVANLHKHPDRRFCCLHVVRHWVGSHMFLESQRGHRILSGSVFSVNNGMDQVYPSVPFSNSTTTTASLSSVLFTLFSCTGWIFSSSNSSFQPWIFRCSPVRSFPKSHGRSFRWEYSGRTLALDRYRLVSLPTNIRIPEKTSSHSLRTGQSPSLNGYVCVYI